MDKKTLAKIKESLEERKKMIEAELSNIAKPDDKIKGNYRSDFPNFGDKEDENANEVAEYTENLSVEFTLEKTLRDINNALESIAKGDYGVCKYCGEDIPVKRLLARPSSSACVDCKDKLTSS